MIERPLRITTEVEDAEGASLAQGAHQLRVWPLKRCDSYDQLV